MELFDHYDRVLYSGKTLTNILRRAKPIKNILDRIDVYFDYEIKEGERADTLAHDYYGSSTYTWLIYITNNIYDPYYQWPMTDNQLFEFIEKKYGDPYQAQIDIHHYQHADKDFVVSPYTFQNWTIEEQFGWSPVTNYQHEDNVNESKRYIKLVSNRYLNQVVQQVEELFT